LLIVDEYNTLAIGLSMMTNISTLKQRQLRCIAVRPIDYLDEALGRMP
jgi:predicted HAD superfamily phosphohydrolase YqeG